MRPLFPCVESKWGPRVRYIHTPESYPGRRSFYRTARGSHDLCGLGAASQAHAESR
jgi:hypothetical protein